MSRQPGSEPSRERRRESADRRERPLGRSEWIREALRVLGEKGIDAVRVDVLAKRLAITRGSFYWHFRDRDALLTGMLDHWHRRQTEGIVEVVNRHYDDPRERLQYLLTLAVDPRPGALGGAVELGIRDWARRDPRVARVLEGVDSERLAYVARQFTTLGLEPADAEARAFAYYSYIVGEGTIRVAKESRRDREQRLRACGAFLLPFAERGAIKLAPKRGGRTRARTPRRPPGA